MTLTKLRSKCANNHSMTKNNIYWTCVNGKDYALCKECRRINRRNSVTRKRAKDKKIK